MSAWKRELQGDLRLSTSSVISFGQLLIVKSRIPGLYAERYGPEMFKSFFLDW